MQNHRGIISLDLSSNNIGAETLGRFLQIIQNHPTITSLNLNGNNIGIGGVQAIIDALRDNTSITSLRLSDNNIGNEGAVILAEFLQNHPTITSVNLSDNNIGIGGVRAIIDALRDNTSITSLNLNNNDIGDDGAATLAEFLQNHPIITSIYLSRNHIGEEGIRALTETLRYNTVITSLELYDGFLFRETYQEMANMVRDNARLAIAMQQPLSRETMEQISEILQRSDEIRTQTILQRVQEVYGQRSDRVVTVLEKIIEGHSSEREILHLILEQSTNLIEEFTLSWIANALGNKVFPFSDFFERLTITKQPPIKGCFSAVIYEFLGIEEIIQLYEYQQDQSSILNQHILSPDYEYDDQDINTIMGLRVEELRQQGSIIGQVLTVNAVSAENTEMLRTSLTYAMGEGIDEGTRILIPLNIGENHWVGMAVHILGNNTATISLMDSLDHQNAAYENIYQNAYSTIAHVLWDVAHIEAVNIEVINVPRQAYGSNDCGPETIENLMNYVSPEANQEYHRAHHVRLLNAQHNIQSETVLNENGMLEVHPHSYNEKVHISNIEISEHLCQTLPDNQNNVSLKPYDEGTSTPRLIIENSECYASSYSQDNISSGKNLLETPVSKEKVDTPRSGVDYREQHNSVPNQDSVPQWRDSTGGLLSSVEGTRKCPPNVRPKTSQKERLFLTIIVSHFNLLNKL